MFPPSFPVSEEAAIMELLHQEAVWLALRKLSANVVESVTSVS